MGAVAELWEQAQHRWHLDPVLHARAALAVRVAEAKHRRPLAGWTAQIAREAACVALAAVEQPLPGAGVAGERVPLDGECGTCGAEVARDALMDTGAVVLSPWRHLLRSRNADHAVTYVRFPRAAR